MAQNTGETFPRSEIIGVFALGVIALAFTGVQPALAGALADLHRLSAANIGLSATLEALSVAAATSIASFLLKPSHIRIVAIVGCLGAAAANLATLGTADTTFLIARVGAGIPEGLLLWIPVGLIARIKSPERWSAVLFTGLTIVSLLIAGAFAFFVLPRFSADGGFATLATLSLVGLAFIPLMPATLSTLSQGTSVETALPIRGWLALLALLIYSAAGSAMPPYLQPIAHQAGLGADTARTALWVSLLMQILGGLVATAVAGRLRYVVVFAVCTAASLGVYALFFGHPQAWIFIAGYGVMGLVSIFASAYAVPFAIDADPSRKTAVTSAGVQVLAIALGPLCSAMLVTNADAHGALWFAAACRVAGLAIIAALFIFSDHTKSHGSR